MTWKTIKGYELLYQVSDTGLVREFRTKRPVPTRLSGKRYVLVDLYRNGERSTHSVHRLVATTFLPNIEKYPMVNHKNKRRWDNRVDNLEWCDGSWNQEHSYLGSGREKEKLPNLTDFFSTSIDDVVHLL